MSNIIAKDRLKSIIERVENLVEEKNAIAETIKDVFAEAKGAGFDVPILKAVIKLRKLDAAKREEVDFLMDTYLNALGMLTDNKGE